MQFYTTTRVVVPDGYTLMTAPRPLPGEQIGRRDGSGFGVYLIADDYRALADRDDAQPILVVDEAWETAQVAALEYGPAYADLIAAGDTTAREVISDRGMFRYTLIELLGDRR